MIHACFTHLLPSHDLFIQLSAAEERGRTPIDKARKYESPHTKLLETLQHGIPKLMDLLISGKHDMALFLLSCNDLWSHDGE